MWDIPSNIRHHQLDHAVFKKWTNNKSPYKIINIDTPKSRKRVIYLIKF